MLLTLWITLNIYCTNAELWTNNELTGKSYYVTTHNVTRNMAKTECEQRGSRLAVIASDVDSRFVSNLSARTSNEHWIGLEKGNQDCSCAGSHECPDKRRCMQCRKSWGWIDGTLMSYQNWACKRPLDGNRACGVIKGGLAITWDATNCNNKRFSICQYDCKPSLCMRTECASEGDAYQCTCDEGYTGQHCDQDINECQSEPCLHAATCVDEINRYLCQCREGFTGQHCETDVNECESDPCSTERICKDLINGFECVCKEGFTGENCDEKVEENKADKGEVIAFAIGSVLLAMAFIGMIITIVIYIRTSPNGAEIQVDKNVERRESEENESRSVRQFDEINDNIEKP